MCKYCITSTAKEYKVTIAVVILGLVYYMYKQNVRLKDVVALCKECKFNIDKIYKKVWSEEE